MDSSRLNPNVKEKAPLLGTRMIPQHKKKKSGNSAWLPRLKDSLGTAMVLGLILFESYYLTAIALSQAFAVTAIATALTGGIGLGIALTSIVIISAYLGYKHYRHNQQRENIQRAQDDLQQELTMKHKECYQLKDQLNHSNQHDNKGPNPNPDTKFKLRTQRSTRPGMQRNTMYYANNHTNHLFKNPPSHKPRKSVNKDDVMYYANNTNNIFKSCAKKIMLRRHLKSRCAGPSANANAALKMMRH